MTRTTTHGAIAAGAALLTLLIANDPALADQPPPCSQEAAAVQAMKVRDHSLRSPTEPEAAKHIAAAKRAYGVGEYDRAIDEYVAAGLQTDSTIVLYNLAQTYRAAKEYEKAIRQYRLFLDRGQPGPEVTALVTCFIASMEAEMAHAASTAPPSGPGPDDNDDEEQTAAPIGPSPVTETRAESPSMWTPVRGTAVGVGALALVAVGAGVVLGINAEDLKDEAASICPSNPCANAAEANALSARADTRATAANVSFAAGGVLAVGAAVLWFVGAPDREGSASDSRTVIQPRVSPGYAGAELAVRF